MLKVPKGQPTEKDTIEFSLALARAETMQTLAGLGGEHGPSKDVLSARPAGGEESIALCLCRLVALEWNIANRLNQIVKKPPLTGEEIWLPFWEEGGAHDVIPDYEEILDVMQKARVQLVDTLRSANNDIMDTVLMPGHDGLAGTVRYWCVALGQFESAQRARIDLLAAMMK